MGFLSDSKDRLVEAMAPGVLNAGVLRPYGRLADLRLNSDGRELDLTLELDGELEPVKVHIQEYELVREGSELFLIIRRVITSRAWLTALARNLAVDRRLKLAPEVAKQVARFL
jgi:hypothetical protein